MPAEGQGSDLKWIWCAAAGLLLLTGGLLWHLAERLFRQVFSRPKRYATVSEARQTTRHYQAAKPGMELLKTLPVEDVSIPSRDGLRLHGRYYPPPKPGGPVVLGIHGYRSYAELEFGPFAAFDREQGFGLLLPDGRGHAPSEGDYVGFGVPDRLDCVDWAKWLAHRLGESGVIFLHGVSMGAATVLGASGEPDLPPQVKGIAADCGFTALGDEFRTQFWNHTHLPRFPFLPLVEGINRHRQGFGFWEHTPLEQVQKAAVPVLLVHGTADPVVPVEMARRLYEACPTRTELLLVEGAGHAESIVYAPEDYHAALLRLWNTKQSE